MHDENNEFTNPIDIVNTFSTEFSKFYCMNSLSPQITTNIFNSFDIGPFSDDTIMKVMKSLKPTLLSGDDQIPQLSSQRSVLCANQPLENYS